MGSTSALEASRAMNRLKFHVEEVASHCEQSLDFLLPHVDAILTEMESRVPPGELLLISSPEPILPPPTPPPLVVPAFPATKKNRLKKTRPSTSSSPTHSSYPAFNPMQRLDLYATSTLSSEFSNLAASQFSSADVTSYQSPGHFSEHSQAPMLRRNKNKKPVFSGVPHNSNPRQIAQNSSLHTASSSTSSPIQIPHSTSVSTFSGPFPEDDLLTFQESIATSQHSSANDSVLFHGSAGSSVTMTTTISSNPNNERLFTTSAPSSTINQSSTTQARRAASSGTTDSSSERDVKTRLLDAAKRGSVEDVLGALDGGAIVNSTDGTGKTALHVAAWNGHADIVALLLTNGADANNRANPYAYTPLHVATLAGHAQCVAFLIDAGVEIDCTSRNGSTPLHMAAMSGHEMIVHILVAAGASRTLQDESGKTAFDMAVTSAIQEVLIV